MVTIQEVAERAGVSISTVSNVLNKKKFVSQELQERVYRAVEELDYVADSVARNMKRGYTKNIGVITSDMCGLFYPYVVQGIYQVLSQEGYHLTICDAHVEPGEKSLVKEREAFRSLFSNRVDGVIFVSSVSSREEAAYLEEIKREAGRLKKTPLVSLERDFSAFGIDSVYYDNRKTAGLAVEHLISRGCRRIAHIAGPRQEQIPEERKEGYLETLDKSGLGSGYIVYGDYSHQSGYQAMLELLSAQERPDGVYCANDQMAVGALKALKEWGIAVPEEIKVVGSDDVFVASVVEPGISTVHIKKTSMGQRAAELLLQRIREGEQDNLPPAAEEMEIRLVVRKSTDAQARDDWSVQDW